VLAATHSEHGDRGEANEETHDALMQAVAMRRLPPSPLARFEDCVRVSFYLTHLISKASVREHAASL
jgi:hypothetical protein